MGVRNAQLGADLFALLVRQSRAIRKAGVVNRIGHRKDALFGHAHRLVERGICRTYSKSPAATPIERSHKRLACQALQRTTAQSQMRLSASENRQSARLSGGYRD